MLTVTQECRFDAAHVLSNHAGQCKNLHGHTYRVIVEVSGAEPGKDMVIDFKDLKKIMEEVILSRFDHAFIYDQSSEAEREIAEVITRHGMKSMALPFRSTAENLARYIFEGIAEKAPNVSAVRVFETPDSCAIFTKDTE